MSVFIYATIDKFAVFFILIGTSVVFSRFCAFNSLISLLQWGLSLASFWDSTSLCESLQELHGRVQLSWDILKGYDHDSSSDINSTNVDCAPLQLHSGVGFLVCLTLRSAYLERNIRWKVQLTEREKKCKLFYSAKNKK